MAQKQQFNKSYIPSVLECSLCLDMFDDPRNLPCGHTFCLKCLEKSINTKKKSDPNCSLCRKIWKVPEEGLTGLSKNFVADSFKDSVPSTRDCILSSDGRKHGAVEYFCVNCWDALCSICRESHQYTKVTKDHQIKSIRDLSGEDIESHRKQVSSMCSFHKTQEVVVYCKECKDVACTVCCVTKHSKHDCTELGEADVNFIETIKKSLNDGQQALKDTTEEMEKIKIGHMTLKNHQDTMAKEVKQSANELREKIKSAYETVMKKINDIEHETLQKIVAEMDNKFNREYNEFDAHGKKLKNQNMSCERLLSPASCVVERAKLVKQVTREPPIAKKSKLIVQNNDQKITEAADIVKKYEFSNAKNFTKPTITNIINYNVPDIGGNYIQFISISDNKFVCGKLSTNIIYVYNIINQNRLVYISAPANVMDGVMTSNDNILCSMADNTLAIFAMAGAIVMRPTMMSPRGLFIREDGDILLAADKSLYKSTDDGCTWKEIMKSPDDNTQLYYVVQVTCPQAESVDTYWVTETVNNMWRLSEYQVDSNQKVTRRDIDTTNGRVTQYSRLAYDGEDNVMMSDFSNHAVHMYSVFEAQYKCQLAINYLNYPVGIAYDLEKDHLCVGLYNYNRIDAYKFSKPIKGRTEFEIKVKI